MSQLIFLPVNFAFSNNVPVSADTIRWTYTVPGGSRALFTYGKVRVIEAAAAAFGSAYIRINILGASGVLINFLGVLTQNGISDRVVFFASQVPLLGGDVVQCSSGNAAAVPIFMECLAVIQEFQ